MTFFERLKLFGHRHRKGIGAALGIVGAVSFFSPFSAWADTAEDLNRQELQRIISGSPAIIPTAQVKFNLPSPVKTVVPLTTADLNRQELLRITNHAVTTAPPAPSRKMVYQPPAVSPVAQAVPKIATPAYSPQPAGNISATLHLENYPNVKMMVKDTEIVMGTPGNPVNAPLPYGEIAIVDWVQEGSPAAHIVEEGGRRIYLFQENLLFPAKYEKYVPSIYRPQVAYEYKQSITQTAVYLVDTPKYGAGDPLRDKPQKFKRTANAGAGTFFADCFGASKDKLSSADGISYSGKNQTVRIALQNNGSLLIRETIGKNMRQLEVAQKKNGFNVTGQITTGKKISPVDVRVSQSGILLGADARKFAGLIRRAQKTFPVARI